MTSATRPGEMDVVGADGEKHEIELAVGILLRAPGQHVAQLVELSRHGAGQRPPRPDIRWRACAPNKPTSMVAPVQASGRKVTASAGSRPRARARCAAGSCRASGGRPPTIQRRRGAPSRRWRRRRAAGLSSQALSPLKPAGRGGNIRCAPAPRKWRKQKPSSASATGRSGLPSPAAIESPRPAISRSRTAISVDALSRCRPAA